MLPSRGKAESVVIPATLEVVPFHGEEIRSREVCGLRLSRTIYGSELELGAHCHDRPFVMVVLRGGFRESCSHGVIECRPSTILFRAARYAHEDRFAVGGAECFRVELGRDWTARLDHRADLLAPCVHTRGGMAACHAARLLEAFYESDDVSALTIEGTVLELLAELARSARGAGEGRPGRWLREVHEAATARFAETWSLTDLAAEAGVHPVHLARQFRKHYGYSVGELVRRLRVESARIKLVETNLPLARIAIEAGFAAQSHLSSEFKRHTGLTPAQYRAAFREFSLPVRQRASG